MLYLEPNLETFIIFHNIVIYFLKVQEKHPETNEIYLNCDVYDGFSNSGANLLLNGI